MHQDDDAIEVARAEVLRRIYPSTRQLLGPHEVLSDAAGRPSVARVDSTSEFGRYRVYFELRGESYHFVVIVQPNKVGVLDVAGIYIQAAVRVYLLLSSKRLTADDIAHRIGIKSTRMKVREMPFDHDTGGPRLGTEYMWFLEVLEGVPGSLEEKIGTLADQIEPAVEAIAALQPDCEACLHIVYDTWNEDLGGLHFDERSTRVLGKIGASIDVDLYASGPHMLEEVGGDSGPE